MSVAERYRRTLKRLLWLYFWLLIFEGALRKWFLPHLSAPLLVARDPVVLAIYALALARGIFPRNGYVMCTLILAGFGFFASFWGMGNLKITLFGLHADFLHLPLIFLVPRIFDFNDVKQLGKWVLVLSVPMAVLAVLQFRASPGSWINAAASGGQEGGGQLFAAIGRIRPAGVFSFVTGMVSFLTLVAAFLGRHFADNKVYPTKLVYAAMGALAVSLMVSGSRSAVASVAIVVAVLMLVGLSRGAASLGYLKYAVLFCAAFFIMTRIPVFHEGLMVHEQRFENGGGIHEGLVLRFWDELANSFHECAVAPPLGMGLGLGTNAGAGLLSGQRQFLLSEEGEWGRVISESGAVAGLAYIALRFAIFFHILRAALRSFRMGNSLPVLLLGATGLDLLTGQFGQPTELGFVIFTSGLCLVPPAAGPEAAPAPMEEGAPLPAKIRGRSAYAEALHGDKPKGGA
ncbi:MAG TPA: hypothetical protein VG733_07170 [Chthoniobacteraceae bacterium]|nr:hypothetical protein [Chthoniobacteraceae bacterium]